MSVIWIEQMPSNCPSIDLYQPLQAKTRVWNEMDKLWGSGMCFTDDMKLCVWQAFPVYLNI